MKKPKERKSKIIFIDAKEELRIERNSAWLEPKHIKKISDAYWKYKDVEGFAKVLNNKDVFSNNGNLNIQLYIKQKIETSEQKTEELIEQVQIGQKNINSALDNLYSELKKIGIA